jgi:glyceraldehyde 3-phosphate dehydrogenase
MGINDPFMSPDYVAYMLRYDTIHGQFKGCIEHDDSSVTVNGKKIPFFAEKNPADIPWGKVGADYIVDATGIFHEKAKAQAHIDAGAKKVVYSGPSKDDTPMFVCGVNLDKYTKDMTFVSNASCTTNCLAPVAKVLQEKIGIERGLMTTIHAYTGDQNLVDGPHKDLRRARAAALNIIPTKTGAAAAVSLVIPELKGKFDGFALRVPTPTGSVTDLTFIPSRETSVDEINALMKDASETYLKGILEYTEDPIVSSDIVSDSHSAIFDAKQTKVIGNLVKILAWYDNEWGYSCRLVDLTCLVADKL